MSIVAEDAAVSPAKLAEALYSMPKEVMLNALRQNLCWLHYYRLSNPHQGSSCRFFSETAYFVQPQSMKCQSDEV